MTDTKPIALVTGASRGIGAAIALELAATHHVVAVARTTGALEELDDRIKAMGGEATLAPMDIAVDAAMQQLCRSIHDRWGQVDLWVHAAIHAGPLSPATDITDKDMDRSLAVNVAATSRLIRYLSPLLGDAGRAVFFNDDQIGTALWASYGTTKAAQMALVRGWQDETHKTGPDVRILSPAPMPTGTRARFYPGQNTDSLTTPAQEARRLMPEITG